ncbi:AEC family transporter [Mesorhizobium sp. LNHC232B00]|uniref:AEC family transporter n=1 Tax=Mesorhizobium TaxID=68287 RepID=UPI0026924080
MANTLIVALTPIFFVLALGYGAGRLRIVDNGHVDSFNALVMEIALPASLFAATASAPRLELVAQAPLFIILGAVMLLVFLAWFFVQVRLGNATKADASLQGLTIAFPNLAGVGLPILADVLGSAGTVPLAVALASGSIIVSPVSLIIVELSRQQDGVASAFTTRIVGSLWRALTKPVVLAPAFGIVFSLSGLKTDAITDACLLLIGHAAPGVALFLTGLVLSAQPFRLNWTVVCATGAADIVRPSLAVAVVSVVPVPAETANIIILLAAVPSGFFGILFAVNYRLDSATIGSMVAASTVVSIVTLAVAIAMLFPK